MLGCYNFELDEYEIFAASYSVRFRSTATRSFDAESGAMVRPTPYRSTLKKPLLGAGESERPG